MGKPSPPSPPDPARTASAQTATNIGTAIANANLGMVDQYGPLGSLTYRQAGTGGVPDSVSRRYQELQATATGAKSASHRAAAERAMQTLEDRHNFSGGDGFTYVDPNTGRETFIPRYEQITELTPEGEYLQDRNLETQRNLADIGASQSGRIGDLLNDPVELGNEAVEARLMELGRDRLDPMLDRRRAAREQQLRNQGLVPGSEAYNRAMETTLEAENDAYNQLLLTGRGQALNEQLTERNQPLNEIAALLSGSAVQQPQFGNVAMPQIATTDYAGLENAAYGQQMAGYNSRMNQYNSLMGGLFGLGASGIVGLGPSLFGGRQ